MTNEVELDVYPLRAHRLLFPEDAPRVAVLQLNTEHEGEGLTHSYFVNSELMRELALSLNAAADDLDRQTHLLLFGPQRSDYVNHKPQLGSRFY